MGCGFLDNSKMCVLVFSTDIPEFLIDFEMSGGSIDKNESRIRINTAKSTLNFSLTF